MVAIWKLVLVFVLGMLLQACASQSITTFPEDEASHLLDGQALFGETIPAANPVDIMNLSPEMAAFVDDDISGSKSSYVRFRRLIKRLIEEGHFDNPYDANANFSASETFSERRGNCISYTNMFVALAREAGLEAKYQLVRARPDWGAESGFLIRSNHVNVLIDPIFIPGSENSQMIVDFNRAIPLDEDDQNTEVISDEFAQALYYSNMAMDYLRSGDTRTAFAHLKRAIQTDATNYDLWNNLGTIYSVADRNDLAERVYRTVLEMEHNNKTAMSGLAKTLVNQERFEEAAEYEKAVARYQQRNPYYHYAVAQQAYHSELFDEALVAINDAIDIKKTSRFYALRAATARGLGDLALAEESTRLQRKYLKRRGSSWSAANAFN